MDSINQPEDDGGAASRDADRLASARAAYLRDQGPIPRSLLGADRMTLSRAVKEEPSVLRVRHDGLERFRTNTTVLSDGRLLVVVLGRPRPGTQRIWFLVWGSPFGMCVRGVLELANGIKQFVVLPGQRDFAAFKAGRIVVGFWRGGKLQEALEYDYSRADHATALAEIALDAEKGQEEILRAPDVFLDGQRVLEASFGKLFAHWHTRLDWLQVGWVEACGREYPALMHGIAKLPDIVAEVSTRSELRDFPTMTKLLTYASVWDTSERLRSLLDAFADPRVATGFVNEMHDMFKLREGCDEVFLEALTGVLTRLKMVWGARSLNHETSDGGRLQAFTNGWSLLDGRFEIDYANFQIESDEDAREYWTAQGSEPLFDAPYYLDAWDIPADFHKLRSAWETETVSLDPFSAEPTVRGLIAEAVSLRRWTIPPRAEVRMRVGPFVTVELTEIVDEVYFVWRTATHRYWVTSVGVRECTFNSNYMGDPEGSGHSIDASMRLLMAALVRDFWVAEEREAVFDISKDPNPAGPKSVRVGPRVVYLPRVPYGHSGDGLARLTLGLRNAERARHYVRPFLRKAQPSPVQVEIAKRQRVQLPAGHTWVQGHFRGGGESQVVYRSRSAMNLLYEVLPPSTEHVLKIGSWFDFERSVAKLLEYHLGFTILDRAVRGRGDQGIDILATKRSAGGVEVWVVQCKHYADRNPVGPRVVRELLGAVTAVINKDKINAVRGLLVTSGRLSGEALKLCATHGIQSYDGSQLEMIGRAVNQTGVNSLTTNIRT